MASMGARFAPLGAALLSASVLFVNDMHAAASAGSICGNECRAIPVQ